MSVASANPHNVAVKRIMREYAELQATPSHEFVANPLDDNLFEWHFTIAGAQETDYAGGRYHGRILLPSQYPFKPPDIMMLTPSGRFETQKKICLSISSFHPKNWQPSWSIRTVLTALIAFFPSPPQGAIGSLDYSSAEKRAYAHRSGDWTCELCGKCNKEILPYTQQSPAPKDSRFTPATHNTNTATTTPVQPSSTTSPTPTPCTETAAPPPPLLTTTASQPNTTISSPPASSLTFSYANTPVKPPAMSRTMSDPTTEMKEEKQAEQPQPQPQPQPAYVAAPAPAPVPVPVPVPVAPVSPPPHPAPSQSMSHITVTLAFLIIAILLRKLIAHINNRSAIFGLTSDFDLD